MLINRPCGDGFDLHKLVIVAEHCDAHQGAWHVGVAKLVPDYLPGGYQVLPPGRGDENSGADDVLQRCTGVGEGGPQVLDGLGGLARVVTECGGGSVFVRREGPGKEDQSCFGRRRLLPDQRRSGGRLAVSLYRHGALVVRVVSGSRFAKGSFIRYLMVRYLRKLKEECRAGAANAWPGGPGGRCE